MQNHETRPLTAIFWPSLCWVFLSASCFCWRWKQRSWFCHPNCSGFVESQYGSWEWDWHCRLGLLWRMIALLCHTSGNPIHIHYYILKAQLPGADQFIPFFQELHFSHCSPFQDPNSIVMTIDMHLTLPPGFIEYTRRVSSCKSSTSGWGGPVYSMLSLHLNF